jgi:hypothetical protein
MRAGLPRLAEGIGTRKRSRTSLSALRRRATDSHWSRNLTGKSIELDHKAAFSDCVRCADGSLPFPVTQFRVQHWSDDDDPPEDRYDEVVCQACAGLHFFNPKTGKVLGERNE